MNTTLSSVIGKYWKWAVVLAGIAVIGYKAMFAPFTVLTQPVSVGEVVAEVMGTGTLEAHYQGTVSAQIQAPLVEYLVDQNDWVKSGQLLARLDDSDIKREVTTQEAVVKAAEATVQRTIADENKAKANLVKARLDYDRYSGLLATKSISQDQMDKTVQSLEVAKAELAAATAAIAEARRQEVAAKERLHYQEARLAYTRITAPFDGLIARRDREVGDIVVPGSSIFLLVSKRELWISAWVDEYQMAGLAPGQPTRVVFRSEPKKQFPGRVTRLGNEVDRETREFRVDCGVDELPTNWGVGQRAEVYIETARKPEVTNIPLKAIVSRNSKPGAYVIDNGHARWKEVTLGLRGIDKAEVAQGLTKGDKVIIGPQTAQLADGKRVTSQ
ncbi:MAG: efflux RND transporter periplasmic adaptor subunit [Desulfomonilaceae bacterium]